MKKKIIIAAFAVAVCLSAVIAHACKCRAFTGDDYPAYYSEFHNGHKYPNYSNDPKDACMAAYGDFKSVR